jgi:hypothetical protein
MYSVPGNLKRFGEGLTSPRSFGIRDMVLMHPDDVLALRAWVMAKRMHERDLIRPSRDGYVYGWMPG